MTSFRRAEAGSVDEKAYSIGNELDDRSGELPESELGLFRANVDLTVRGPLAVTFLGCGRLTEIHESRADKSAASAKIADALALGSSRREELTALSRETLITDSRIGFSVSQPENASCFIRSLSRIH